MCDRFILNQSEKTNDLSADIFQLLKNSEDSTNGFEKELIYDAEGLFHIVHPEDDRYKRSEDGAFIQKIENKANKFIDDGFMLCEKCYKEC